MRIVTAPADTHQPHAARGTQTPAAGRSGTYRPPGADSGTTGAVGPATPRIHTRGHRYTPPRAPADTVTALALDFLAGAAGQRGPELVALELERRAVLAAARHQREQEAAAHRRAYDAAAHRLRRERRHHWLGS